MTTATCIQLFHDYLLCNNYDKYSQGVNWQVLQLLRLVLQYLRQVLLLLQQVLQLLRQVVQEGQELHVSQERHILIRRGSFLGGKDV